MLLSALRRIGQAVYFFGLMSIAYAVRVPNGLAIELVTGGGDSLPGATLSLEFNLVPTTEQFVYASVDSASGAAGFLANDCTFGVLANCAWSPSGNGTPVDFAVSLIPLTAAQVSAYNAGLGATDGKLVQFPLFATPLTIPARNAANTANGTLLLTDSALCGIFSGQLTDWSLFSSNMTPGPFVVVYDSQPGSGATWLLTQHLNAVCTHQNSTFSHIPVPVTSDFTSLPIHGGVVGNSHFAGAAGSAAIQSALLANSSAIGYLGPTYTNIAPNSNVTAKLYVASLINRFNFIAYLPNIANTTLALQNPGPNAAHTVPPMSLVTSSDPTNWVPTAPSPALGYPIVGYASWVFSSCYVSAGPAVLQYLTAPSMPQQQAGDTKHAGFATLTAVSTSYGNQVSRTLTGNASGYNLNIQNAAVCAPGVGR